MEDLFKLASSCNCCGIYVEFIEHNDIISKTDIYKTYERVCEFQKL